jgi:DUF971 family protein
MDGTPPEKVGLSGPRDALVLDYTGGRTEIIRAARLRLACRCALCTRARIDGLFPDSFDTITISSISAVGEYGINIRFSDGHDRGIYPWGFLATLLEN